MKFLAALIALTACMMTNLSVAHAHPRQETETSISFNPRSGKTEIVHRFRIIDAETALADHLGKRLDMMIDPAAHRAFEDYVQNRFELRGEHAEIPLSMVGSELAEGSLWVYQEGPPLPKDQAVLVRDSMLMEVLPKQVNIIYVETTSPAQTLVLTRRSPWKAFRADGGDAY